MHRLFTFFVLLVSIVVATPTLAQEQAVAGLRSLEGSAWVVRDGETISAVNGMDLFVKDILRTGEDGSLGLVFKDDTRLSLGPSSQAVLEDFVFEPAEERYSFLTRVGKGTAAFLTGQMSRLSPESMSVETPRANIGIRGTHFLVQVEE